MKRIDWKKLGIIVLWTLSISGVIASLAFSEKEQNRVVCKQITININKDDENFFINKEDIYHIIFTGGDSLVGNSLSTINVKTLEKFITDNKYVKSADAYLDLNGKLCIEVKQRKPVLRVINTASNSFYIDEDGLKMPLSNNYSARVPVVNGNIAESYGGIYDSVQTQLVKDLYALAQYIHHDTFWDAQIEQIYVQENNDLILIPRVGNHKILLGDITDLKEKFENLIVFYTRALPKVGWDTYSVINVKYKGQIIGVKSGVTEPILNAPTDSVKIDSTNINNTNHI